MIETRFTLWSPYENLTHEEKIQILHNAIDFYDGMPGEIPQRMADRRRELLRRLEQGESV